MWRCRTHISSSRRLRKTYERPVTTQSITLSSPQKMRGHTYTPGTQFQTESLSNSTRGLLPLFYHWPRRCQLTSPTPATTPTHSYLSNQKVYPTTALTILIHQSLQYNAATMAQIHSRPPPPSAPQPSPLYQYKPQILPFKNRTLYHQRNPYSLYKLRHTRQNPSTSESTTLSWVKGTKDYRGGNTKGQTLVVT